MGPVLSFLSARKWRYESLWDIFPDFSSFLSCTGADGPTPGGESKAVGSSWATSMLRDRYVMLSPKLLQILRDWWRVDRPMDRPQRWLFPGDEGDNHIGRSGGSVVHQFTPRLAAWPFHPRNIRSFESGGRPVEPLPVGSSAGFKFSLDAHLHPATL
jgi:hypothetical protein